MPGCSSETVEIMTIYKTDSSSAVIIVLFTQKHTHEKDDISDDISVMDALQPVKTYCQGVMGVVKVTHVQN